MDQYHHKDLRNSLIEKGIELVHMEGITSFSLRKTAAACKVSHAAPYAHFQNKEELLEAMQEYITEQFAQTLEVCLHKHAKDPDVMVPMGKAYLSFFLQHPHYFSFLYHQSHIVIDISQEADHEHNYRPFELYRTTVLALMDAYDYSKEKQNDVVIAMWSFVHGITALATMNHVKSDINWESKIVEYMHLFSCSFMKQEDTL